MGGGGAMAKQRGSVVRKGFSWLVETSDTYWGNNVVERRQATTLLDQVQIKEMQNCSGPWRGGEGVGECVSLLVATWQAIATCAACSVQRAAMCRAS